MYHQDYKSYVYSITQRYWHTWSVICLGGDSRLLSVFFIWTERTGWFWVFPKCLLTAYIVYCGTVRKLEEEAVFFIVLSSFFLRSRTKLLVYWRCIKGLLLYYWCLRSSRKIMTISTPDFVFRGRQIEPCPGAWVSTVAWQSLMWLGSKLTLSTLVGTHLRVNTRWHWPGSP